MRRLWITAALVLGPHLAWAADAGTAQVEKLVQTQQSWDGSTLPAYAAGQPEVTVLRITIPPGATLDWHRHPVINVGYMLAGSLTVEKDNGQTTTIRTGDVLPEVVSARHRGFNPGAEPAVILVFYAGTPGGALSEK